MTRPIYDPPLMFSSERTAAIDAAFDAKFDAFFGKLMLPCEGETGDWRLKVENLESVPTIPWYHGIERELHGFTFLLWASTDSVRSELFVWVRWQCLKGIGSGVTKSRRF